MALVAGNKIVTDAAYKQHSPNEQLKKVAGASALATKMPDAKKAVSTRAAVQSANWTCPVGSTLTYESNGSGNLVCRNDLTGRETRAIAAGGGGGGGGTISPGGGGSASTGGGGTSGTTTATGAAGRYLEAGADTFARNPEAMLADLLNQQYGDRANGLYEMLKPYADAANVLFLAHQGNSMDGGSKDDFLNYLDNYWSQLQTPGARIDWQTALNNIMNPAEGSPLEAYLSGGNPEDQAGNYLRLMAGVGQTSFHPLFARALMDRLGLEADRYMGQSAREQVDPFYRTVQSTLPAPKRLVPYG